MDKHKPAEVETIQLVAILRVLDCSQDQAASILHISKTTVWETEKWLKSAPLETVKGVFDDQALKRVVGRELPLLEEVEPRLLVRAGQVTADDILRHYRTDYPPKAVQLEGQPPSKPGSSSAQEEAMASLIEKRTNEHQDDLRQLVLDWREVLNVPDLTRALQELRIENTQWPFYLYSYGEIRTVRSWWGMELKVEEENKTIKATIVGWRPGEAKDQTLFKAAFFPSPGAHPLPGEFWDSYGKFNRSLSQMFTTGGQLFNALKAEFQKCISLPQANYPKCGLWPSFLELAGSEAWKQYRGLSLLKYKYSPGPDGTVQLNLAGSGLGCGSREEMVEAKQVHIKLVAWLAKRLGPLKECHEDATSTLDRARIALLDVYTRGVFGGKCKLCPGLANP